MISGAPVWGRLIFLVNWQNMKIKQKYQYIFAAAAFVAAYIFFQFFYPYHLMRREQQTLFLFDLPYIFRTYSGPGCISRFLGDFLEQFFCFKVAGPLVVAALLTAIGTLSYKICRNFSGRKVSLLISTIIYIWCFLRETETIYITRYTIAVAGYLLCIWAALKFRKPVLKFGSLAVFLALALLLFGNPYHKNYGKLIGKPDLEFEKLISLDVETSRENWDKVLEVSKKNLLYNEACYFYNLALAKKGLLSETLLQHPQNYANGLFLLVTDQISPFSNGLAGEVWYQLGNMTLADQSAMVAMQSSPKHTGARYIRRMAMLNLISEEYGSAEKYLKMLDKTLVYHKWAESMIPENQSEETKADLDARRRNLVRTDVVSESNNYRLLLHKLLEANPGNTMAKEYLLCYDLLNCNLAAFMEDYVPEKNNPKVYQEAALIWINIQHSEGNISNDVDMDKFGITMDAIERLKKFYQFPNRYKSTYWSYYTNAMGE